MRYLLLTLLLAGVAGCDRNSEETLRVQIVPTIATRVTGLHFDSGDRIGLRIMKGSEVYLQHQALTYDQGAFSAEGLLWYPTSETSTLTAYYPYCEQGLPSQFTVAADQRGGCSASDLLGAVKKEVVPGSAPVGMVFNHLLSQLTVVVTNQTQAVVTGLTVGGFVPTADVDLNTPAATAGAGVAASDVSAFCVSAGVEYQAVLVPQQADLTVTVTTDDGQRHSKTVTRAQFDSGKRYDLAVTLTTAGLSLSLSGDIGDWEPGGSIGGGGSSDGGNSLVYEGVTYPTIRIGARVWMAENLRYIPTGATIGAGVWYPAGEQSNMAKMGMLYDHATALAGGTTPVERGICPEGWRLPSAEELTGLSTNAPTDFFCSAGWWLSNSSSYGNITQGLLMSSSLSEDSKMVCLSYGSASGLIQKQILATFGVSVRCVKN